MPKNAKIRENPKMAKNGRSAKMPKIGLFQEMAQNAQKPKNAHFGQKPKICENGAICENTPWRLNRDKVLKDTPPLQIFLFQSDIIQ